MERPSLPRYRQHSIARSVVLHLLPGALITAFYIDQLAPAPPGGLPVPLDGKYSLSNRHLEYALTWWGLALTLVGVYAAFVVSRLQQSEP